MRQAIFILLWTLATLAQTTKQEEFSTVQGQVLNAATGEPMGKVSLLLISNDAPSYLGTKNHAASSDATGKFSIRDVDRGKYRLRASRNGFVTMEFGARASQRAGTVLDLDHPEHLKDIEIRLTPHGVIAGRILDADGEPLANAQVQLLRSQYVNGKKMLSTTNVASTNDLGEYRWAGLTPGRYYIYAENFEGLPPTSPVKEDYVPIYYPSAADPTGAAPIDVAAGSQVRATDVILRKALTATVKGRVVVELPGAHGIPVVRFFQRASHNNASAGTFRSPSAKVNPAGGFEIRNLAPGTYTVQAEVAMGNVGFTGRTTLDVAGTSIDGVVITIGNGLTVTGRIRVDGEGTQDLQNASVALQRWDSTAGLMSSGWTSRIAKDRTFKIGSLEPDRYALSIEGLPNGFYTKSIPVGEAVVTYSGIDLTSGVPGTIDVLVSPKAATISGVAQNPVTSKPAQGATAVLVPKEKERLKLAAFYWKATTDQYGRFTFASVIPGDYKIYVWEDVEPTAWMDPEFMNPLESKGESVTVSESAQANVQVNLIPADSENEKKN